MSEDDKNFFDKFGLEVQHTNIDNIEIGQSSPIYGMITSILERDSVDSEVAVVVNYSMKIVCNIKEEDKIQILRERAFEPGIFVVTFEKKNKEAIVPEPNEVNSDTVFPFEGSCSTIVFGRRQEFNA